MKNSSNPLKLLIVFLLLLITSFCGLNFIINSDYQFNNVVTASSVTHNFQIKNCENISEAITSVTSQYSNTDYAIAFFHKNQDLTIDANGNYLVHKDIFESKTGIKLTSNLNEMYDLTELASLHGYEVTNGEFNIILTRKFGTKRLMLETQKNDFNLYGAVAVSSHDNFYILQYATEEQTATAYNHYLRNNEISNVVPDSICWSESETSRFEDIPFDDTYNHTWGYQAMGVDKYQKYLNEIINASNINRKEL